MGVFLFLNLKKCVMKLRVFWFICSFSGRRVMCRIIFEVFNLGRGLIFRSLRWIMLVFIFCFLVFWLYVVNFFYVEVGMWLKMLRFFIWMFMLLRVFLKLGGNVSILMLILDNLKVILCWWLCCKWRCFGFGFEGCVVWLVDVVMVVFVIDFVLVVLLWRFLLIVCVSFCGLWLVGMLM